MFWIENLQNGCICKTSEHTPCILYVINPTIHIHSQEWHKIFTFIFKVHQENSGRKKQKVQKAIKDECLSRERRNASFRV